MPELDATVSVIEYIQGVQESPARTKKKKKYDSQSRDIHPVLIAGKGFI